MRVIAGKYKGRKLIAPKCETRPTLDRTKETLFNILNFQIVGKSFLDLFAGSGQIGIEALSRGADYVVFCDNNKDAVNAIKQNCANIGIDNPNIYCCGYEQCLKAVNKQFDIVFVDPPYRDGLYQECLSLLESLNLLTESGIVICEHLYSDAFENKIGNFEKYDERKIGTVCFSFYRRSNV